MTSKIPNHHQLIYVRDFIPKLCYIIKGCLLLFLTTIQITTILLYSIYLYTTQPYSYSYPTHIPLPSGPFQFFGWVHTPSEKKLFTKKSFQKKNYFPRKKVFEKKSFSAPAQEKNYFSIIHANPPCIYFRFDYSFYGRYKILSVGISLFGGYS